MTNTWIMQDYATSPYDTNCSVTRLLSFGMICCSGGLLLAFRFFSFEDFLLTQLMNIPPDYKQRETLNKIEKQCNDFEVMLCSVTGQ